MPACGSGGRRGAVVLCVWLVILMSASLLALFTYTTQFSSPSQLLNTQDTGHTVTHKSFTRNTPHDSFEPLQGRGLFTFRNVCIEHTPVPMTESLSLRTRTITYNVTRQVVVYNSHFESNYEKFLVGASLQIPLRKASWSLNFTKKSIPSDHKVTNRVAFFLHFTCPGNLHHFWEDEFSMLYSVILSSKRLKPGAENQVIYRHPWNIAQEELDCMDVRTYEEILKTLHIFPQHDWFSHLEPNVCFSRAVFGLATIRPLDPRAPVDFVKEQLKINQSICTGGQAVTIVQRTYRRILNLEELVESLQQTGRFGRVQVVQFENLTVTEQLQMACCSYIMIGVNGAGLQWSIFMAPGSVLAEIAWPKSFWDHYYRPIADNYSLKYVPLEARTVHPNWQMYSDRFRGGQEISNEEKKVLTTTVPKSVTQDNVWKYADVTVDAQILVDQVIVRMTEIS